jgi:hypothetical protein
MRHGGRPPVAGPVLYFFLLFSFVCHACQTEAHGKYLTLCREALATVVATSRLQQRRLPQLDTPPQHWAKTL